MSATSSQLLGLRKAREMARKQGHLLERFEQTIDSAHPDTTFGREYVTECRRCQGAVIVYFPFNREELEDQGINSDSAQTVISRRYQHTSKALMTVRLPRNECV